MESITRKRLDLSLFKTVGFWTSVGLSVAVLTFYILSRPEIGRIPAIGMLEIVEAKTLDLRFLLRGTREPKERIVIVAVDEQTEDDLGRWHSSGRRWLAQLLDILHTGKASVVGFDINFAEPDEGINLSLLDDLKQQYQERLPQAISTYPLLLTYLDQARDRHDYDLQFARALELAGNVVLGIYFLDAAGATHLTPEKQAVYRQIISPVAYESIQFPRGMTASPLRLRSYAGVEPNLPLFSDAARSFGHFNVVPDRDEKIRFSPLLVEYAGAYYPSLPLEAARAYLNPPLPPIVHALGIEGGGYVQTIELGDILIPCDEEGKLLINYYGPVQPFPITRFLT
jgi:adenylate cyclase